MQIDAGSRIGELLSLLEFSLHESDERFFVSCDRTSDYYLELALWGIASLPFLILVVTMVFYMFSFGLLGRILLGSIAGGAFTVAIVLLGNTVQMLRDAFRVITFIPSTGTITLHRGILSTHREVFAFVDVAGIRVSHFSTKHFITRGLIEAYEINLIFNDGEVLTLFPCVKDYQQAHDLGLALTSKTGISQL